MTKRPTKKTAPPADAAPAIPPAASTAAPSDGTLPSEGGGEAGGSEALPFGAADGGLPAALPSSHVEITGRSTTNDLPASTVFALDSALNSPENLRHGDIVVSLEEQIASLSAEDRERLVLAMALVAARNQPFLPLGNTVEFTAGVGIGEQLDPGAVPPAIDAGPRQEFEVISPVQLDGTHHDIGDPIFLTRAGHAELKLAGVVSGEWDERDE